MPLTIGHISYLNCVPFFHYLHQTGFGGEIVHGVPARLNDMLAAGDIDISPSSSFEYARNWRRYVLLPRLSISSIGEVKSVLLFSAVPLEELEGKPIALTGESATSVHLVQLLLREFVGLDRIDCRVPPQPVEDVVAEGGAALLIGDRALREAQRDRSRHVFDLGHLWHEYTGLPFVFALWIVRREVADHHKIELQKLAEQLQSSRRRAFTDLEAVADNVPERQWMDRADLVDYWRSMSYDFTDEHRRGLILYFRLLVKYGFIPEMPDLRFLD
ncbi:MAG: menaquinone biosynthesis protein [Desulfuromonadales bacterium]|nr:menaquinone biosynthesis protein [Desulfuromonadales bacterium]NIR32994.1 menaquinone biosynthesis protein [Desulfuromonadales bacterium]NIS40332.1 menaquinone biosynthesis protein [Desulfuromonadales bacterium]